MELQISCNNCGVHTKLSGTITILPENHEHFRISEIEVYVDADENEILTDISDINVEVRSIRFNCKKCGDYIILEELPYHSISR